MLPQSARPRRAHPSLTRLQQIEVINDRHNRSSGGQPVAQRKNDWRNVLNIIDPQSGTAAYSDPRKTGPIPKGC